jgi:hypothetical protein
VSAEVFISYRRADKDGWGRALRDALARELGEETVFFDTATIRPPDRFPQAIADALSACRVFLAVIGPDWLNVENTRKLADPADWVRKEIEHALSGDRYIIPVLVGGAEPPLGERLPKTLEGLLHWQAFYLRDEGNWDQHIASLASWVRDSIPSLRTFSSRPPNLSNASYPPEGISSLCNRLVQEDEIGSAVEKLVAKGAGGTMVCVLPGHRNEAHGSFVSRLRDKKVLEQAAGEWARRAGMVINPLQFAPLKLRTLKVEAREFDELFRSMMVAVLSMSRSSTYEAVRAQLARHEQPTVWTLGVTVSDLKGLSLSEFLSRLVDAWQRLFPSSSDAALGVHASPRSLSLLWINVRYDEHDGRIDLDELRRSVAAAENSIVLTELEPITADHIDTWLEEPEVRPHTIGRATRIQNLIKDPRHVIEKGKMRMQQFIDAVWLILIDRQTSGEV